MVRFIESGDKLQKQAAGLQDGSFLPAINRGYKFYKLQPLRIVFFFKPQLHICFRPFIGAPIRSTQKTGDMAHFVPNCQVQRLISMLPCSKLPAGARSRECMICISDRPKWCSAYLPYTFKVKVMLYFSVFLCCSGFVELVDVFVFALLFWLRYMIVVSVLWRFAVIYWMRWVVDDDDDDDDDVIMVLWFEMVKNMYIYIHIWWYIYMYI